MLPSLIKHVDHSKSTIFLASDNWLILKRLHFKPSTKYTFLIVREVFPTQPILKILPLTLSPKVTIPPWATKVDKMVESPIMCLEQLLSKVPKDVFPWSIGRGQQVKCMWKPFVGPKKYFLYDSTRVDKMSIPSTRLACGGSTRMDFGLLPFVLPWSLFPFGVRPIEFSLVSSFTLWPPSPKSLSLVNSFAPSSFSPSWVIPRGVLQRLFWDLQILLSNTLKMRYPSWVTWLLYQLKVSMWDRVN